MVLPQYINSISGHTVDTDAGAHFYNGTKFAVTALTEGLRKELRDLKSNIKVTVSLQEKQHIFYVRLIVLLLL